MGGERRHKREEQTKWKRGEGKGEGEGGGERSEGKGCSSLNSQYGKSLQAVILAERYRAILVNLV